MRKLRVTLRQLAITIVTTVATAGAGAFADQLFHKPAGAHHHSHRHSAPIVGSGMFGGATSALLLRRRS